MSLDRLTLVLNASYEGVNIVPARRALTLVLKGAAVVEKVSRYTIRTARIDIPVPSVVRLLRYRRLPRLSRSVSRRGYFCETATAASTADRSAHRGI